MASIDIGAVLDKVRTILAGEPARAIGYGGAAIIYLVAKASGRIPDVSPEEALTQAVAAIAVVASFVETIRHFVYSPATVAGMQDELTAPDGAASEDLSDEGNVTHG